MCTGWCFWYRYHLVVVVFFFVKQKTAYEWRISDWSSDLCSSDLSIEWPLTFMGNSYQGIGRLFFPFRASDNPGPVLMTFNADEKAGKLTFEPFSNGQALSPLQAALVKGSPYARCGKVPVQHSSEQPPDPTPAAAATPVAWTNLPAMVGKYQGDFDLFGSGAIATELKRPLGGKLGNG